MRIGMAQTNPTLGQFKDNATSILKEINRARSKHCELVVFPEAALFGYHPFDLLERQETVKNQLAQLDVIIKKMPEGIAALIGVFTVNKNKKGRPYFNSVALVQKNKKPKFFHKQLLPTGDVFDEARFIEPGETKNNFFLFKKKRILLTICEDIWAWPNDKGKSPYRSNPIEKLPVKPKLDLIINVSASPYFPEKLAIRKSLAAKCVKRFKAPMIYCNLVGGQDEIIFDGASFALGADGKTIGQSMMFEPDFNVLDLKTLESGNRSVDFSQIEQARQAIVLGIRDYCRKTGFQRVHLGLSGGIDSAVVATLAVDALGAGNVDTYFLKGPFSADESQILAQKLATNLGCKFTELSIDSQYQSVLAELSKTGVSGFSVVNENLQSRLRGIILMAIANQKSSMLLNTSNKSECATGYSTLYGDMCGGLAPIADLTKTKVIALANLYNQDRELIPERIIARPPTAELRENQKDQDSLPPYPVLDRAVENLVEDCLPAKTKIEKWLLKKLYQTEFKRWQFPPIIKVTKHSFGRGRRWPMAHRTEV